ncbi:MAG: hypothetical protein SVS85_02650 [Candidatus Nanohaloarchaea archaeon]|nr:hypothetical protein [Candidatus Nanohaloarchaea archaeon]
MDVTERIEPVENGEVALLVSEADEYVDTNTEVLNHLITEDGLPGVYVTVNKPYDTVKDILEERGVPTDRLFFVDAITRETGSEPTDAEDAVFIETPENLTDLSIAVRESVESMETEHEFLFLDSLSTLLIYNEMDSVSMFAHFLTNKIRDWNVAGVMMSVEEEVDDRLIGRMSEFCDDVVHV